MIYQGKECEIEYFYGMTLDAAGRNMRSRCEGRNILKTVHKVTSQEPPHHCIVAYIEKVPSRQQLNEG